MISFPEDYAELDTWLNTLNQYGWKQVEKAKVGGWEAVIKVLRSFGNDLRLWTDEELLEYLIANEEHWNDFYLPMEYRA